MLARKLVTPAVRKFVAPRVMARAAPSFSTMLERKEKADESRYIKQMESKREDELRKKMEEILALDGDHEDKQQLVNLLSEKKEEKRTLLTILGDWKVSVPVGIFLAIPALANGYLVIDPELQLVSSFLLFVSTAYTQLGPLLHKSLVATGTETANAIAGVDKTLSVQALDLVETNNEQGDVATDAKAFVELVDDIAILEARNNSLAAEQGFAEAIEKKLNHLHALEENASSAVRNRTVSFVKNDVVQRFTQDKAARDNALQAAIAALAGGETGKLGKDVVGEAFSSSLKGYTDKYVKADPKTDSILVQLEKDVAATLADFSASAKASPAH